VRARLIVGALSLMTVIGCAAPAPSPSLQSVTVAPATPSPAAPMPSLQSVTPAPTPIPATASPTAPQIETAPPPSAPIRTFDTSGPFACAGIGLIGATLQGDPHDPRVAWIAVKVHGTRGVIFPKGFTARFTPNLEILDATGQVKFRAGDAIDGGCLWGQADLLIGWP